MQPQNPHGALRTCIEREPSGVSCSGVLCPFCHPTNSVTTPKESYSTDSNQRKCPILYGPLPDCWGKKHCCVYTRVSGIMHQNSVNYLSSLLLLPARLWHFLTLCLEVIFQVRCRDGMSTQQNVWYTQSHASRICHGGFPLLWFSSSWVSFSYGRSCLTAETFLWPHCL